MTHNPYAPPHAEELPPHGHRSPHDNLPEALRAAELVRQEHLHHETRVRGSGLFFFVISVGLLAICLVGLHSDIGGDPHMTGKIMPLNVCLGFGAASVLSGWVGWALRRLDRRILVPGTLLASLFLPFLPIGTALGVYVLWLLHSNKGRMVLSQDYGTIRAPSPPTSCGGL